MDAVKLYNYENDPQNWKIFSFSGGPTQLPRYVAHKVQKEFLNLNGCGLSILESPSNNTLCHQIITQAVTDLRYLYQVPSDFKILFCAGGGTLVFDALPMNLMKNKTTASYINTGYWSNRAVNEAKILCPKLHFPTQMKVQFYFYDRNILQKNDKGEIYVPEMSEWTSCEDSAYLHYCDNETVEGLEYPFVPKVAGVPLVSDMSSNFLTKAVDWSRTDVVYAHAQKNIGIAGSAIVIIRESLVDNKKLAMTPYMCDFDEMIKQQSNINALPIFPIYMNQQVFSWMKNFGTVNEWEEIMNRRPKGIYDLIDSSHGFYRGVVQKNWRSRINISFNLPSQQETENFLKHCGDHGLIEIMGHRSLGGCRISLYVPVPQIGIDKLRDVMEDYMDQKI